MSVTTTKIMRDGDSRKAIYANWFALFTIIVAAGTVSLLYSKGVVGFWKDGTVYTCIVMLIVFVFVRVFRLDMTRLRQAGFVLLGIGVAVIFMNPQYQSIWKNITGLQLSSLGLLDITTSGLVISTELLMVLILVLLVFGIWIAPRFRHMKRLPRF